MDALTTTNASRKGFPSIARLSVMGQEFPFRLQSKNISLGSAGKIQNIWLENAALRSPMKFNDFNNYSSVISYTRAKGISLGLKNDIVDVSRYILALCLPSVLKQKGVQKIYRDAYLRRGFSSSLEMDCTDIQTRCNQNRCNLLSCEDYDRIKTIVKTRDFFNLRKELDGVLGFFEPPQKVLPLLQEAMRVWLGKAISILKSGTNEDLLNLIQCEIKPLISKYIKDGGNLWVRNFVYMFSYESKIMYYSCYANCWSSLIPWLKENWKIDELTERFLGIWHNQNKSTVMPMENKWTSLLANCGNNTQAISFPFGATRVRDVFNGQVLALHPLGNYLLDDPALREKLGNFLQDDKAYNRVYKDGYHDLSSSYWSFIEAILIAANQYRKDLESQRLQRNVRISSVNLDQILNGPSGRDFFGIDVNSESFFSCFLENSNRRSSCCNDEIRFESPGSFDNFREISLLCSCSGCGFIKPYCFRLN